MKSTNLRNPIRGDKLDSITGLLPPQPLDLAQFEGHTYKPQSKFVALLTECKRQREEIVSLKKSLHLISADRADKDAQIAKLREALETLVGRMDGCDLGPVHHGREIADIIACEADQARAALAATHGDA